MSRRAALGTAAAIGCVLVYPVLAAYGIPDYSHLQPADRGIVQNIAAGDSVQERPIRLFEHGDPDAPHRILVVGCIHGDEPAGIAIAERLEGMTVPKEIDLWVITSSNPDGVAQRTRTNADGVDLNRNFPWRWRPIGRQGDRHYSGPRPLSEPESRLLAREIERLRPEITIWFHQPFGVVDQSGGDVAIERRFASLAGLPLQRLPRYPGGVTDWQNARFPGTTSFVVELPAGPLSPLRVGQFARAVLAVAPR
ncbi:MAG: murein peptide amidase A [Actinobacteria bacterium]|nr:MAG: murein peptide amidase A [Actinomycetota bacterium]